MQSADCTMLRPSPAWPHFPFLSCLSSASLLCCCFCFSLIAIVVIFDLVLFDWLSLTFVTGKTKPEMALEFRSSIYCLRPSIGRAITACVSSFQREGALFIAKSPRSLCLTVPFVLALFRCSVDSMADKLSRLR